VQGAGFGMFAFTLHPAPCTLTPFYAKILQ
jgi:hypothetical protein